MDNFYKLPLNTVENLKYTEKSGSVWLRMAIKETYCLYIYIVDTAERRPGKQDYGLPSTAVWFTDEKRVITDHKIPEERLAGLTFESEVDRQSVVLQGYMQKIADYAFKQMDLEFLERKRHAKYSTSYFIDKKSEVRVSTHRFSAFKKLGVSVVPSCGDFYLDVTVDYEIELWDSVKHIMLEIQASHGELNELAVQEMRDMLAGAVIAFDSGRYLITDVNFLETPGSVADYNGKEISHANFLRDQHNLKLESMRQPMLQCQSFGNSNHSMQIVPELAYIVKFSHGMVQNEDFTQTVATFTKLDDKIRAEILGRLMDRLLFSLIFTNWNIKLEQSPVCTIKRIGKEFRHYLHDWIVVVRENDVQRVGKLIQPIKMHFNRYATIANEPKLVVTGEASDADTLIKDVTPMLNRDSSKRIKNKFILFVTNCSPNVFTTVKIGIQKNYKTPAVYFDSSKLLEPLDTSTVMALTENIYNDIIKSRMEDQENVAVITAGSDVDFRDPELIKPLLERMKSLKKPRKVVVIFTTHSDHNASVFKDKLDLIRKHFAEGLYKFQPKISFLIKTAVRLPLLENSDPHMRIYEVSNLNERQRDVCDFQYYALSSSGFMNNIQKMITFIETQVVRGTPNPCDFFIFYSHEPYFLN